MAQFYSINTQTPVCLHILTGHVDGFRCQFDKSLQHITYIGSNTGRTSRSKL